MRGYRGVLRIGARFALWVEVLLERLAKMRHAAPDVSIRGENGHEHALMMRLVERSMAIGLMYTPERRHGLTVVFFSKRSLSWSPSMNQLWETDRPDTYTWTGVRSSTIQTSFALP